MTVVSGLAAWSLGLYVGPLEDEFGWSRAQVSVGFSLGILTAGLAGPMIGKWVDRFGPRSAVMIGAILSAVTFQLLASTGSLWQWYLFSAINAATRQMMFFIPFQALTSRWFDRRRGAALSLLGIGFSLGGFLVLPLLAFVIELTDWRGGFIFSGVLSAALVLPLAAFVIRDDPTTEEWEEFGEARERGGASPVSGCEHRAEFSDTYADLLGPGFGADAVLLRPDRLDRAPCAILRIQGHLA